MRLKLALLIALLASSPQVLMAKSSPAKAPEEILADAERYTVKVEVQTTIGLRNDERGRSSGTGFLIDKGRGWILTNAHVASRSPGRITVAFKDGEPVLAKRIHVDAFMDVAILAIPLSEIPAAAIPAKLECSGLPSSGASVFAYGHPSGLDFTASRGIVSGASWFPPFTLVQTDATINAGNSGGPLIRVSDGLVVGVSSHSYKDTEDKNATSVGLAQPVPPICHLVDLLKQGRDARTKLLPVDIATGRNGRGPTVAGYAEGSRLLPGDRVVSINGSTAITTYPDLLDRLRGANQPVKVRVKRGGADLEVLSNLRTVPDPLGHKAINISGVIISEPWRVDNAEVDPAGNLVAVDFDTEADLGASDVRASDRLKYVNGRSFARIDDLYEYLDGLKDGAELEMIFWQVPEYKEFSGGHIVARMRKSKLERVSAVGIE